MNYKIDNSINTEKTFIQEYLDIKESLLNELGNYLSDKYNTPVVPIAIVKSTYGKATRTHLFYYYKDNTIVLEALFVEIDKPIYIIFKKYGFNIIEKYISNTIIPEKKSFIDKWNHKKFNAYVYAMTDVSILYIDTNCNSKIIYDDSDAIEIDYTEDNLILINNL